MGRISASHRLVSLRWLLPGIGTAMLATVVAIFGTIAYRQVRASTLQSAVERLRTVAGALAQPTAQTGAWIRTARRIAENPAIVQAARGDAGAVASAGTALRQLAPDTGLTVAAELRREDGRVLISVVSALVDSLVAAARTGSPDQTRSSEVRGATEASPAELPANMRLTQTYGDTAEASKLFAWEGRVLHERAVPVHHGGRIVGHVVEIRLVSQAPNAVRQVQRLIGKEAALAVGNLDGSLWTDLSRVIDHPAPSDTLLYVRSGRTWVGASARLPGGPWIVSTELPQDAVLASVFALRWRLVAIGAAIVVLAAIVAAWLSRWLTTPLARLTAAAEGIAEGDRTVHRLATHRSDEIGRLARAFAVMAENVHASRDTLEHRIGERTSELTVALERLRATQEELLRKERFATLGHVSSSIAHELRNPLGVMTNVLYYLEAVLADAPPKVREYLAKLQVQVRLSESIITGLLEVTRTNAANPAAVSVHALVEEQIQRAAIPTTIRVESNVPSDLPEVWVDRVQIGQVLFNLLTNAMQAMAGAPGVLSLSARTDGDHVRIDVADTGPGIPTDHLAKIFEPLFTTKARGIGLGLSVSRALASANRAMLTASNRPEGGALLSLEVPTLASVAAAGAEGRHPTAEVSGPNASTAIMART